MKKEVLIVLLVLMPTAMAHTGSNHTEDQLATEQHQRGDEFQFVRGDYPLETKQIVIVEIVLVALLLGASINHYYRKSED